MVEKLSTIGILGYQGCIEPHEQMYARLGIPTRRVRTPEDLAAIDRLILPGGESTTMLRFIKLHNMVEPLRAFTQSKPTWGICAGSILLAQEVKNPNQLSLGAIDITAHRNYYGSQLDSFVAPLSIDLLPTAIDAHFIRAPLLTARPPSPGRTDVTIHATLEGQPIFFSQGHIWACSFHVELGTDARLHEVFASL